MGLLLNNLLFTVVAPGTAAVHIPLYIAGDRPFAPGPGLVSGITVLAVGASIYGSCLWQSASFGRRLLRRGAR